MAEPQTETDHRTDQPAAADNAARRRIIEVLAAAQTDGVPADDLHARMADSLIGSGLIADNPAGTGVPTMKPVKDKPKPKQAYRSPKRSGAATLVEAVGEWVTGAVLLLIAAAALLGPGLYNEIMEDRTLSVLDLDSTGIADTPLADLVDLRGNVDSYAQDKDADPTVAEKAKRILDEAIDERINGR